MKHCKPSPLSRFQMAILFSFLILLLNVIALFGSGCLMALFTRIGIVSSDTAHQPVFLVYFAILACLVGTVLAFFFSKVPLKPFRKLQQAADRIADGDYSVRIDEQGPDELRDLYHSFNHMAEQLESVELLSNDFVNHFSHEFKTPIVSIRGFAKMLERDDLSPEERKEYLGIIIKESERLADLSNNVLSLSRIEQQTILTNKTQCNISEQIRLAIAMLDSKWQDKQIDYQFNSGEYYTEGNDEMLQQVWTNLLDNSVKFSPKSGTVEISIKQDEDTLNVYITNHGEPIAPEAQSHLFEKFYQGDSSHHTAGNGLGLSIASQIIRLHQGTLQLVKSDDKGTTFQVTLPIHS